VGPEHQVTSPELIFQHRTQVLFDAEYRTACRRLLARAVPGLPALRKTTRAEAIAAAVCWVIGKGNQRFGGTDGELRVKDSA
jgi:hypothetical protein